MNFKRGENPHKALDIGAQRKETTLLYKYAYQYAADWYNDMDVFDDEKLLEWETVAEDYSITTSCDKQTIIEQAINDIVVFLKAENYHQEMIKDSDFGNNTSKRDYFNIL